MPLKNPRLTRLLSALLASQLLLSTAPATVLTPPRVGVQAAADDQKEGMDAFVNKRKAVFGHR